MVRVEKQNTAMHGRTINKWDLIHGEERVGTIREDAKSNRFAKFRMFVCDGDTVIHTCYGPDLSLLIQYAELLVCPKD